MRLLRKLRSHDNRAAAGAAQHNRARPEPTSLPSRRIARDPEDRRIRLLETSAQQNRQTLDPRDGFRGDDVIVAAMSVFPQNRATDMTHPPSRNEAHRDCRHELSARVFGQEINLAVKCVEAPFNQRAQTRRRTAQRGGPRIADFQVLRKPKVTEDCVSPPITLPPSK